MFLFVLLVKVFTSSWNCSILMTGQQRKSQVVLCCWLQTESLIRRVCSLPQNTGHTFPTWRNTWPVVFFVQACVDFEVCRKRTRFCGCGCDGNSCSWFFFCTKDVSYSLHSFCNHILFTYLSFVFLSFIPSALSSFGSICSPGRVCGSSWQDSGVPAGRSEVEPINLMTINDLRLASMIYNQGESFTARTTRQTRWQRPKCNDLESQAAAPWKLQWKLNRSFLNWEKNREFIIGGCNDDDDEEVEVAYLAKSPPPLPRQIRSNFRVAACLFATFICQ